MIFNFCARQPCEIKDYLFCLFQAQLRGNKPHMVLTMCQKNGKWQDGSGDKIPEFSMSVGGMAYARLFEPIGFSNKIHDHVEWDKE